MSRSYNFKPEIKKSHGRQQVDRKVILSDFEIEYLELSLGPNIHLKV